MPATTFSTIKRKGGAYTLDATAVSELASLTSSNTVSDVLDILSALTARAHTVGSNAIGKASSVLN